MTPETDAALGSMQPVSPREPRLGPRQVVVILAVFVALNLLWRAVRFGINPVMWGDETMLAVNLQARGFADLLKPLMFSQLAPPGFLWIGEATTRVLGFSEQALRLWPAIAGTIALGVLVLLARRHLRSREVVLVVGLLAVSYYPMRHSNEFKPYSTDLLVAATMLLLTLEIARRATVWRWVALTLVGVVGAWVSFPSVLVAGGAGVWLLVTFVRRGDRANVAATVVYGVATLASAAVMYVAITDMRVTETEKYRDMTMWKESFPPLKEPARLPLWLLKAHTGRMMAYPNGGPHYGSSLTLILCIAGGVRLWRTNRRAMLWLLLAPLGFGLIGAAAGKYPYSGTARTMQYAVPTICILAGVGMVAVLALVLRRRANLGVYITCGVLATLPIFGIALDIHNPHHNPSDPAVRRLVRAMAADATPDDAWVFLRGMPSRTGRPGEFQVFNSPAASQTQFYAKRLSPATLLFAPPPARMTEVLPTGRVLLLVYVKTDDTQLAAQLAAPYVEALATHRPSPTIQRSPIDDEFDLVVYTFAPNASSKANEAAKLN